MKQFIFPLALGTVSASMSIPAYAAEPIVGRCKRSNGTLLRYYAAGGNQYCDKVMTGEYKG